MKLTTTVGDLKPALKAVDGVLCRRKASIPILSTALLIADHRKTRLIGTDLDMQLTRSLSAEIEAEGQVVIDPRHLLALIVGRPADTPVTIAKTIDSNATVHKVSVTVGGDTILTAELLHPQDPEDYPVERWTFDTFEMNLPPEHLRDMFARTYWASSTEETRYYLNGVYVTSQQGMLTTVATDGHKLALYHVPWDGFDSKAWAKTIAGAIIPRKLVKTVIGHCPAKDANAPVGISFSEKARAVRFEIGMDTVIEGKTIDGTYPDYQRVIPKKSHARIEFPRRDIANHFRTLNRFGNDGMAGITMDVGDDQIHLTRKTVDCGQAEVLAPAIAPDKARIGVNGRYMSLVLSKVQGDSVRMEWSTDGMPKPDGPVAAPISVTSPEDKDFRAIVMPMRV